MDHVQRLAVQRAQDALRIATQPDVRAKDRARYSLANAIACLKSERTHGGSFEAEISEDLARAQPTTTANSLLVPWWALRDLSVATNGGGYLVPTDVKVDNLADALRGTSIIASLPITVIANASANFDIPREAATPTAYVIANEVTQIPDTSPTLGAVAMTPKTVGVYIEASRKFLMMTGGGGEAYARRTVLKTLGAGVDAVAISGGGTNGEPLGLVAQITGSVSGTDLTEAGIREFETDIGNALGPDCGFVTTRTVASLLNGRQRFTGSSTTLWEGNLHNGVVGGFPAYSSPSVPASHLIFGSWGSFVLGTWGEALELSSNPFANFQAGIVGIRAITSFDVGVVRPSAFSVATAVT